MSGHVHHEQVRFGDLDAMRHLNNVVFLRYFETARINYMRRLMPQHDPANPEHADFGAIVAAVHFEYRAPVLFDDHVAIACQVGHVGRSSFRMDCRMTVDGRLVADGHTVVVAYDYAQGATMPLPDELRARLVEELDP